ncbi:hypothetical protein Alsa3_CDS0071 [Staphylococcus phage Alsa_3]|nr:hypothetical protein Alsa2_CDS0205 [Staphylococcus phage Alsa_2]WNM50940.1 hypothetical protein Alsa3_CDS0071 [Staphylococcus phage Alsa_3]WNM51193.1 hypothetical protein Alsa4_CDS0063 [Staphylococcus phage Alsa_4]WNM56095.1 hypothetical protein CoNPh38_CDS0219 [Staphylococcus phage S-CoN_Ph38]
MIIINLYGLSVHSYILILFPCIMLLLFTLLFIIAQILFKSK